MKNALSRHSLLYLLLLFGGDRFTGFRLADFGEQDGKAAISYLKRISGGRTTFLHEKKRRVQG